MTKIDFTVFNDVELITIIHSLTEQEKRETSKIMKSDINSLNVKFKAELSRRINIYSERLNFLNAKTNNYILFNLLEDKL